MAPSTVALSTAVTGTATSIQKILRDTTPGKFGFLQAFFKTWLKLDLTTLAAALTIFGTISSALVVLKGLGLKMYWWFTALFTASISIGSSDRLNREVLNWLGAQVLTRQATRILTARTEAIQNDAYHHRRAPSERNDFQTEKRVPIQYLPTFGTTWFIYDRNIFLVRFVNTHRSYVMGVPDEYTAAPEGDEPLVVMCLGRSVKPIKKFLNDCRDFAEKQRESYVTVRSSKQQYHRESWDVTILRPIRPLATVHFDETTKAELVADITNYLDPNTRKFYTARGIPYRRGYLLHGPPGTGKTSLSLALAGYFGLELYLLHLPGVRNDSELERLFTELPPRCIVLLEDIDAVGIKRKAEMVEDEDEDDSDEETVKRTRCTLSGVLNVLDGVTSQEGRIVLMTSNMAHKLDKALVRPGRIDKMIFLDTITQKSAENMFLRMYTPDADHLNPDLELKEGELQRLALDFSNAIPDNTFTPAQLQGYLLNRRHSPASAASETKVWVADEKSKMEEIKAHAKKVAEWKAKKRNLKKLELLAKTVGAGDIEIGSVNPSSPVTTMARGTSLKNLEPLAETDGTGDAGAERAKVSSPPDAKEAEGREANAEEAAEADGVVAIVEVNEDATVEEAAETKETIVHADAGKDAEVATEDESLTAAETEQLIRELKPGLLFSNERGSGKSIVDGEKSETGAVLQTKETRVSN